MLSELSNPKYQELQNKYVHLKELKIKNYDPLSELPVDVTLDISDYTKIKIQERPRVGLTWELIAKLTKVRVDYYFSWTRNWSYKNFAFRTSLHDYEKLCSLGFLVIEERCDDGNYVYGEFQK